ncbi:insecticidal toxin complex protein TccC [Bacillus thuringiensis]
MNTKSLYNQTPTISITDNRGLQIRTLEYNRNIDEESINEYITRNTYSLLGDLDSSMDPRLFSQYQNDNQILPNMKYSHSLKGDTLCTKSVDAGRKIGFFDIEGQPTWSIDANGTQTTIEYDLIGRPTAVFEKQKDKYTLQCRERYIYGENEINAKANNLYGQLVRHYDSAGQIQTESFSLLGKPLFQSRRLLKNMNQPSDWSVGDESTWDNLLAAEFYDTSWQYDAQGRMIAQTDAKGNLQKISYNVVGQQQDVSLILSGKKEQSVVNWVEYNAAGQVQRMETGNGILTEYTYEESTQRLMRKKDFRELSAGKKQVLLDYHYEYDPVGNILSISNKSDSIHFFRNQRVVPNRQYTYNALYQLVSSSGRESDSLRQYSSFPSLITPIPLDDSRYVNYFEKYKYDRSGNLIQISHKGACQYTTDIHIDNTSNRGVLKRKNEIPNITESFDSAGNPKELHSGISLEWDTHHQLSLVNMIVREGEDNDWEGYLYDSSGMRVVKRNFQKTKNSIQADTVIYLPSLELRTRQTGNCITESLQVITLDAGSVNIRVLHWEDDTQPDGIENDQYRYSINDHLQSSILELDGHGQVISKEEFYPYGGTALWVARTKIEADYKTIRYSGKERDATGLYYYGFRYYMTWLGRWLNPDPAGTVDGLNLYRMVRNNPINLIDPDGNAPQSPEDIVLNFKEGDLIYGLSQKRHPYRVSVLLSGHVSGEIATTIDEYNNVISKNIHLFGGNDRLEGHNTKRFAENVKVPGPKKLSKAISSSDEHVYPLWEDYFKAGKNNRKFHIPSIYKETAVNFGKDFYHNYSIDNKGEYGGHTPMLLWKRGSKLGLSIAASNQRTKIHFVLDGLNIEHVVNKTKRLTNERKGSPAGPGQSITASELRYIYRNYDKLKGRVTFYEGNEQLSQAPWEHNPKLWGNYKPTNRPIRKAGSKNCTIM